MNQEHAMPAPSLASQIQELTGQATDELIQRTRNRQVAAAAATTPALSRGRASLIALCVSLPVLLILIVLTFFGDALTDALSSPPSPQVARQQAQADLDLVVREIESYRADFSALPQTLAQVAAPARGDWTYTKNINDQYQVVRSVYGQVVSFNSVSQKVVSNER
jgi:hypothetical protein